MTENTVSVVRFRPLGTVPYLKTIEKLGTLRAIFDFSRNSVLDRLEVSCCIRPDWGYSWGHYADTPKNDTPTMALNDTAIRAAKPKKDFTNSRIVAASILPSVHQAHVYGVSNTGSEVVRKSCR